MTTRNVNRDSRGHASQLVVFETKNPDEADTTTHRSSLFGRIQAIDKSIAIARRTGDRHELEMQIDRRARLECGLTIEERELLRTGGTQ